MSTTLNAYYEGLIDLLHSLNIIFSSVDQHGSSETPDHANDVEKHYIDAKAFILSATTKDGSNL